MLGDLTGKRAIVTGAGSGIGEGIATVMVEQGASVAVADLNGDAARRVAEDIGEKAIAICLDVTDVGSVGEAVNTVIARWGTIDILVNNAGVAAAPGEWTDGEREEDWDLTFAVNVKGVAHCCDSVIPYMKQRRYGKIISIASMAGHGSRRKGGAYSVSKAAVMRYTKGLSDDLASYNININAICPGAVWTKFQETGARIRQDTDSSLRDHDLERIFLDRYQDLIPLGRPQTPENIGKMAAFLASDDARNVTGQCINVDGGVIL